MTDLLFVYGTLRDQHLLSGVLGRPLRAGAQHPAVAPGYAAIRYPGQVYPALVRRPGGVAEGIALADLSAFELELLDAFEGDGYRRAILPVMIGEELHEAYAFLPAAPIAENGEPWSLVDWQARHKPKVLASEIESAAVLRAKLIAIRSN